MPREPGGAAVAPRPEDSPAPDFRVAPEGSRLPACCLVALARLLRAMRDRAAADDPTECETLKVQE